MKRKILIIFLFVLIAVVGGTLLLDLFNENDILEHEDFQRYTVNRIIYVSNYSETPVYMMASEHGIRIISIHATQPFFDSARLVQEPDDADVDSNLRDPTYLEALQFIASDSTDKNPYFRENYTCGHFAADFKLNAFEAGYRCGYVVIEFPESCHTIVCFNTTDRGLVFIEPQNDEVVTVTVGEPYWNRTRYEQPQYNDTVVRYTIVW